MKILPELMENNKRWAASMVSADASYFSRLANHQNPEFLWIGCSDSRVPPNQIVGLDPGEVFVHRNIANVVVHSDFNCLSVLEFAVAVLGVKHVIVCGHYGCGGVKAAGQDQHLGLIDNWLRHIRDIRQKHEVELSAISSDSERFDRLCELNVIEQVRNVCHTTVVQEAWARGQSLSIHGWIYAVQDGLLRDLDVTTTSQQEIDEAYRIVAEPGR
jgi:carbonic anhydrase